MENNSYQNRKPIKFVTTRFAEFAEVDPFGHVNSQHYLGYYLDHRFAGMRQYLDLSVKEIGSWPIIFPVTEITIKYHSSLYVDQEFTIESFVESVGESDCEIRLKITRGEKLISDAIKTCVCVDKKTGRRTPWPENTISRFFEKD